MLNSYAIIQTELACFLSNNELTNFMNKLQAELANILLANFSIVNNWLISCTMIQAKLGYLLAIITSLISYRIIEVELAERIIENITYVERPDP